jgi:hypothetical protein
MKVSPYCYCLLFDEKGTADSLLLASGCTAAESRSGFHANFDG